LNSKKHNCNFDLIQKIDILFKKQVKFSVFHKLVDENLNFSLKLQTFDKNMLNTKNYLFLIKLFDACKINNFLKIKIFPIANIYEIENNFIIEYTNNENFRIKYDHNTKNFFLLMRHSEIKNFLIIELGKFYKIVNLLNYKEPMVTLFNLIELQKTLVFNKI